MFYGWAIVWSGLVVSVAQAPMYGPVVSIFVKPIGDEMGWSRFSIAFAFTLGSIVGMIVSAPVGIILDRYGARAVVTASGMIIAGALVGLAVMTEQWHFWVLLGTGRGVAMSGIQMGTMVSVTNWFVRRRGRASAVPSFGVRAGQAIVPLMILPIIVGYGWRQAYWALAVVAVLFIAVPAYVYLRRRPEDHGLLPDGDEPSRDVQDTAHPRPATEVRWSLREAMHVRAFWLLTLVTATGMFGQTAANLHAVANFQDRGMTDALAFTIPAVFAGVSALSTFPWGFAIERIGGRMAMLIIAVMNVLGMVAIITADNYPMAALYAAIAGVAGGGFLVAQRLIWADYFGRYSVGTIRGISSLFIGVLGTMGPLMAGWLRDTTGNYTLAFTITAGVFAVGFVAMLFAPAPKKPVPPVLLYTGS